MQDVHARSPGAEGLDLHEVGLSEVRKPISVRRPQRVVTLSAVFAVAVDLPPDRRGSDLSRNAEILAEVVDETAQSPVDSLEAACERIARELLVRHPYATDSVVSAEADYFRPRGLPGGRSSLEDYRLYARATATRVEGGAARVQRSIGAEAVGMTACPCAMENVRDELRGRHPEIGSLAWETLPMVTHNQRCRTRLTLGWAGSADVEADLLLDAVEAAHSSPTYSILKRGDEARVVLDAHLHPKFVEDVVRDLLASLPERFPHLPGTVWVHARTVSEESIHKYNVVAEHHTSLGELRDRRSA